jgi:hypothetical protein
MVGVGVFTLLAIVVAAPLYAYERHINRENDRAYYKIAADEMTKRWRALVGTPMPSISGSDDLAFATAFYSPDHPFYSRPFHLQYTWSVPPDTVLQRGWAAMCFEADRECIVWMDDVQTRAKNVARSEFAAQRTLWGRPGPVAKIQMMIVPPQASQPPR